MRLAYIVLVTAALPLLGCSTPTVPPKSSITIASWNVEHLAEANGSGCRPRLDSDYAALRAYASSLNADVVAFQEVESVAAAARVFDPAVYTIVMEERPGSPNSKPPCNGAPEFHLNRQATGFAVRKNLQIKRHPDLVSLQTGDPNLRSGVDITVRAAAGAPVRLLSVHLKSGCASGSQGASCNTLRNQVNVLRAWIDARASGPERFAILGDFNRRLALSGDPIWAALDQPLGPTDLTLAAGDASPKCDPRFSSFIDHIVLDPRIVGAGFIFREATFSGERLSDHCAIVIDAQP